MNKLITLSMSLTLMALSACTPQQNSGDTGTKCPASDKNQVVETIMARRSIRKYKPQAVEKDKMDQIIKCGINAPNGRHLESWEVRIINTPEVMKELEEGYNTYLKNNGRTVGKHPSYGAPTLILIAYNKEYDLSQVDCGLLGANMILTAQSLQLGTCCLGGVARYLSSPEGAPVMKRLNLPETHQLLYAIALGYPDEEPAAKSRNIGKVQFVK